MITFSVEGGEHLFVQQLLPAQHNFSSGLGTALGCERTRPAPTGRWGWKGPPGSVAGGERGQDATRVLRRPALPQPHRGAPSISEESKPTRGDYKASSIPASITLRQQQPAPHSSLQAQEKAGSPGRGPQHDGTWSGAGTAEREAPGLRCGAARGVPDVSLNIGYLFL